MKAKHGQVTINELPTKTRLVRFCEKQIDQWLSSHGFENETAETPIEFSVSFTDEGGDEQVACMTEIHCGSAIFRGCDLAVDTQQAFMHSLKRLQATQIPH